MTTVPEEELLNMKEACKALGITVNSYMVAKQLEKNPEYERIGIPVSYRGENRSLANQVAAMKVNCKYQVESSFEENAKEIHKLIRTSLQDPAKKYFVYASIRLFSPGLLDGALMAAHMGYKNDTAEKMISTLGISGDKQTQLGVTNLTNIKLKAEYDTFKVQDFAFVAAPMSTTKDVVSLCTLENKMKVCFSSVKEVSSCMS